MLIYERARELLDTCISLNDRPRTDDEERRFARAAHELAYIVNARDRPGCVVRFSLIQGTYVLRAYADRDNVRFMRAALS